MKTVLAVSALLFIAAAFAADENPDTKAYNERLGLAARAVLFNYKVFRTYADPKFTPEMRLADINDRMSDDDINKDEMVALRAEQWALNNADFSPAVAKNQFHDKLLRSLAAYKELREQSKTDATLVIAKDNELAVKKADQVALTPEALTLDVALPTDKVHAPHPAPAPDAAKEIGKAISAPAAPATTQAGPPPPVSPAPQDANAAFESTVLGKVRVIALRRDAAQSDPKRWMALVDVKETLRGKPAGGVISVYLKSPTEEFGEYSAIDDLRGRRCVWSLSVKNGIAADYTSPFPEQKFDDTDLDKLLGK